jgi:microcystin-dependent protein
MCRILFNRCFENVVLDTCDLHTQTLVSDSAGPFTTVATEPTCSCTVTIGEESPAEVGNMQPYIGMNYIIAIAGIYPPRN